MRKFSFNSPLLEAKLVFLRRFEVRLAVGYISFRVHIQIPFFPLKTGLSFFILISLRVQRERGRQGDNNSQLIKMFFHGVKSQSVAVACFSNRKKKQQLCVFFLFCFVFQENSGRTHLLAAFKHVYLFYWTHNEAVPCAHQGDMSGPTRG